MGLHEDELLDESTGWNFDNLTYKLLQINIVCFPVILFDFFSIFLLIKIIKITYDEKILCLSFIYCRISFVDLFNAELLRC